MAGIVNINSNLNSRRISNKISFEVGEVFSARIISTKKNNRELVLKLVDGWQFSAKTEKPLSYIPEGLVRFEVEDYKDGKLQIKLMENKKDEEKAKDSIENSLEDQRLNIEKEDYRILEKMVRYNMPLTKENISKVKTIINFKNKFMKDENEEDEFIMRFIKSKGVSPDSEEGKKIKTVISDFIRELKGLSEDDILTFLENDIEFTEQNIKSFNRVFKEGNSIFKEILGFKDYIGKDAAEKNTQDNQLILNDLKEELRTKTEAVKDTLKEILKEKDNSYNNTLNGILEKIKDNINDYKVFNTISNQYYYLDIPVNIRDSRYDCKLIIRDNRKAGKKIDTKNVKLVISVSTNNIGLVDAYIKINNENMNIDIKSDEKYMHLLSAGKKSLQEELEGLGYYINVNFDKRYKDANLVNCRDFFQDSNLGSINVTV